jgi:hypothetical protein
MFYPPYLRDIWYFQKYLYSSYFIFRKILKYIFKNKRNLKEKKRLKLNS